MGDDFYSKASLLDKLKSLTAPSKDKVSEALKIIESGESFERYFFHDLDKPGWFEFLRDAHVFEEIRGPETSDDGKTTRFRPWWPGRYLEKVARQVPEGVFLVLQSIKADNPFALTDGGRALLNMPGEFLVDNHKAVVCLVDDWLSREHIGLLPEAVFDLLREYSKCESPNALCDLLAVLSKTYIGERGSAEFRFDSYYYEDLVQKDVPYLISCGSLDVVLVIEKSLRDTISLERGDKDPTLDLSSMWRPSIEDSEQNWGHGYPKDILVTFLRNAAEQLCRTDTKTSRDLLERWLKDDLVILQRLAIHCVRVCDGFGDIARRVALQGWRVFSGGSDRHEYLLLLRDRFQTLETADRVRLLSWIREGPPKEELEEFDKYSRREQLRVLTTIESPLKAMASSELELAEHVLFLEDLKSELGELEHPTFSLYHTTWVGPTSPLTRDEIKEMSPDAFIRWIKDKLAPPYRLMEPSPEGVAELFRQVVAEDPGPYAQAACEFVDDQIWPAYLSALLRGLQEAINAEKFFETGPILAFIESPLKFHKEPFPEDQQSADRVGRYSWVRSGICGLIETMVREESVPLDKQFMDRTQSVLVEITENDSDPTAQSEKENGPPDVDYVTYCINTNRGRAMRALLQHALRRAKMRPEGERKAERGKGPFPPGRRMELYKEYLDQRLDKEPSPSVQSSFGQFLPQLVYLDREWLEDMKAKGKIFPKGVERRSFWEAHWQGYIGFSRFYNDLFLLLKEEYMRAVCELDCYEEGTQSHARFVGRLAEHLMLAYWGGLEPIDGDLLTRFFANAPVGARRTAIRFIGRAIENAKPEKESDLWIRLRNLWEYRVREGHDEELADFVKWLKHCPEDLHEIADLIAPIIPYLHIHYQEKDLIQYVGKTVSLETVPSLALLNSLLKVRESAVNLGARLDVIEQIMKKASAKKDDKDVASQINEAVNRLGESGYYHFRTFLVV